MSILLWFFIYEIDGCILFSFLFTNRGYWRYSFHEKEKHTCLYVEEKIQVKKTKEKDTIPVTIIKTRLK